MNHDPMRWHENVSAEVLSLVISHMSARYLTLMLNMNIPGPVAERVIDKVFTDAVAAALAMGSVDGLEAACAAGKGQLQ